MHPTPYPDVNAILDALLAGVQEILAHQFIGMYLDGSLAIGDFDPQRSDIDFLVVTADELSDEMLRALQALHARIAASDSPWATELEASYIPLQALRRHDPNDALHPHIERGNGNLALEQHECDWVIHRYVLREHGMALVGPPLQALIDPIPADELRQAVRELLRIWWAPMLDDPARLHHAGYRAYAILTMCRVLYTLEYGTVVPKTVAARWAQETLGQRWATLIERALAFPNDVQADDLNEALDWIRYTVERSRPGAPALDPNKQPECIEGSGLGR